ncbi:MAG: sigma-70 family RNA polymerase sigma factor [Bacteroidetes bacterium]|nr:MAG: sigma-70 family RNA polymerase sigma factor [Bacteroidota bacterium]
MAITEQIIQDFRQGKKSAFDRIYASYAPGMYAICLRYARCEDDAQDILQESFIKVYTKREQFRSDNSIGAWIKRITINSALSYIQTNYRLQLSDEERTFDQAILQNQDNEQNERQKVDQLMKVLQALPIGYRTVFNLFVIDNLSHQEIAEYLGISESTSKSQLFKAKKMIRELLKQETVKHDG